MRRSSPDFIPDSDDPYGIVNIVKSVMAPGSCLVISHATQDSVSREETLGGIVSIYDKASAPMIPRRHGDVLKFFDRMDLVHPGFVNISEWRSSQRRCRPVRGLIHGGVARKP